MAAKQPTVGIDHPTVVPTNFEPTDDEEPTDEDAEAADGDDTTDGTDERV